MRRKTYLAAAMAATLALAGSPVHAQVQLYGTVDVAVGTLASQPPGAPNAPITKIKGVHNGGVQTSYFGFRGTEDLGGGLKASFQLESFMRVDSGTNGRFGPLPVQDPFFSRASWVGLQGDFGDIKLGNVANPAWLAMVFSSAMGSNSIFSPGFRQQYNGSTRGNNGLDTSLPNSIAYTTPRLGGMVGTLVYQAKEGPLGGNNFNASVVYRDGPLLLTAATARVRHAPPPDTPAAQDETLTMVGGSYDFKAVKLFAQYSTLKNDLARTKDKMPHIGLTAPLGSGELQLAWASDRTSGATNTTRKTTSLSYIHNLSKRTSVYGMAASDKLPVGTANSYVVGVRHTF